jgi:hypothetical protein
MLGLPDSRRDADPSLQWLLCAVADALSRTTWVLATWQVARVLALHLIEAVLAARARSPIVWPPARSVGPRGGARGLPRAQ